MSHVEYIRFVAFLSVVALIGLAGLAGLVVLLFARVGRRSYSAETQRLAAVGVGCAAAMVGCFLYASLVEPEWIETTHEVVKTNALPTGERLRIVHLTDLHVTGESSSTDSIPARVNALAPDVVIATGDMLSSPKGLPELRKLMEAIHAPEGKFAVKGNHDLEWWVPPNLFDGMATELRGEPVVLRGGKLQLCGAGWDHPDDLRSCLLQTPPEGRIVAFHTPDLVEQLRPLNPILYLAGHTHGGQVRMPFYGALLTFSAFDKKYEMGRYQVGATTLYVSRGLGGTHLRFLCRPEITVIDVVGTG